MNLHLWGLFVAAVFLLSGTPGPNMMHVMTRSVAVGVRRSIATMAGCLGGIVIVLAASAAGLATVLAAVPALFEVLRYGGIAYLVYLGIRAWRAEAAPIDIGTVDPAPSRSAARLFRGGFVISVSNPKLLLFAAAFLPQFVDRTHDQGAQFAILVATFAAIESFWYLVYGLGGRAIARHLERPRWRRAFDRATGCLFIGFGLALLRVQRH